MAGRQLSGARLLRGQLSRTDAQRGTQAVEDELETWARLGHEGHWSGTFPWIRYHEPMRETSARLVGARVGETVCMNTLTVNLHLMMASFYRPSAERYRIVIEDSAFPSDSYAVASQARHHGFDPEAAIVRLEPRDGEDTLRTEDVVDLLEEQGDSIALVLLGGVNYLTGELMDIPAITAATHAAGAVSGWDLAHAVGNVPLSLHDWDVDWAAWCSYKYLNSGPGAIAGASSTSATLVTHRCRAWPAGGATTPRRASGWRPTSCRAETSRAGRSRARRSCRSRPCASRSSCSTGSGWRRCVSARSGSPATSRRWSTACRRHATSSW